MPAEEVSHALSTPIEALHVDSDKLIDAFDKHRSKSHDDDHITKLLHESAESLGLSPKPSDDTKHHLLEDKNDPYQHPDKATTAEPSLTLSASLTVPPVSAIQLQAIQASGYQTFAPLAPNASQLIGHPLVSISVPGSRRAVRIAPLGVLPLPPCGTSALLPEISTPTSAIMAAAQEAGVDAHIASGTGTIGEMPKGKRRGLSSAPSIANEALTPEERTKQKRMLRNRESAARSRDKRKNKNLQLETSIAKHRARRADIDKHIQLLKGVVEMMDAVLRKHGITVPS